MISPTIETSRSIECLLEIKLSRGACHPLIVALVPEKGTGRGVAILATRRSSHGKMLGAKARAQDTDLRALPWREAEPCLVNLAFIQFGKAKRSQGQTRTAWGASLQC
jgi:hypothetical protein